MTNWQPLQAHGDPILHDLTIVPLRPQDQADVKRLILAGLTEHWGQLDPTKNPDLNNIGSHVCTGHLSGARHGWKSSKGLHGHADERFPEPMKDLFSMGVHYQDK
jgi:hypothetical protein